MIDAREWLLKHADGVPDVLRKGMLAAVDAVNRPETSAADVIDEAARRALQEALDDGTDPLSVLVADGLVTYACEILATTEPAALAEYS